MNGATYRDYKGNILNLIDYIHGQNLLFYIHSFQMDYEYYFDNILPTIIRKLLKAFEAILFLHMNGFRHGDVRSDHIIRDESFDNFIWIDFDYDFEIIENPFILDIMGLGKILAYAVGKGFHRYYDIKNDRNAYKNLINTLEPEDFFIIEESILVNLKKLYKIIPKELNDILMHFSIGANITYETVEEFIKDLKMYLKSFS